MVRKSKPKLPDEPPIQTMQMAMDAVIRKEEERKMREKIEKNVE